VDVAKQEFEKQERELKEHFQKQEQEQKELMQKEEFQKADAAEKERQAKELFAKQEFETRKLFREQEVRDRQIVMHMEGLREAFQREQEQHRELLRQEIEVQRQREAQTPEQAREHGRRSKEPEVEKPDYADVVRAEALRNAYELEAQRKVQEKAMSDAFARTDKMGPEEAAAAKEEMRRVLEAKFKEQLADKLREQQERADRLALLYLGPPSGRER
jgi:hypothetical protein